ncbi:hypothetical protein BSZ07_35935 [Streptomyces sp. M1013]|nr:hypothetical protein BSZ07_35935 [Streptomyces sp. M1013]
MSEVAGTMLRMDLMHPLDGLDARPWSSLSHAYGSAEDIPGLLRDLTGADVDAADEALSELYGSVLHQGTVYAASAEAVPFLAELAAAGHRTADVLALLGGMAESEDEYGVAPGAVRAAVADRLPLLLPLLASPEPEVRRTAAWAVSHTRAAAIALPALCARGGTRNANPPCARRSWPGSRGSTRRAERRPLPPFWTRPRRPGCAWQPSSPPSTQAFRGPSPCTPRCCPFCLPTPCAPIKTGSRGGAAAPSPARVSRLSVLDWNVGSGSAEAPHGNRIVGAQADR